MSDISIDFLEYGKRFLSRGVTDYCVLKYSESFMSQGVSSSSPNSFLRSIKLKEFNGEVGTVSTVLVHIESEFGNLNSSLIFSHIQRRREDELDNGIGRMHREFFQINFMLLPQNAIFQKIKEGYSLYSSLLISTKDKRSPVSWKEFSLHNYEGQEKINPSGRKTIPLLTSEQVIQKYFPSFITEYKLDLLNLINETFCLLQKNNISETDEHISVNASPSVNLSHAEMLIYKVQLAQDLQAYVSQYFNFVLSFSTDDITDRNVNIKFHGTSNSLSEKKKIDEVTQVFSGYTSLTDMLSYLYFPNTNNKDK